VASNRLGFLVVAEFGNSIVGANTEPSNIASFTTVPVSTAPGTKADPAIAYYGEYLVVWVDGRKGHQDLWGTRISAEGTNVDGSEAGFLVTEYYPVNTSPALTGGGSFQNFTITWDPTPGGLASGVIAYGIHTVRA
jgi:hypothetical protein